MLIDCILVEINKTKLTTFDLKRNDALQNNLVHFFEIFGWKFGHPEKSERQRKVELFRPPNSYILHRHGECGSFTLYLKGNGMKNSKKWKILNFIHVHYSTTM